MTRSAVTRGSLIFLLALAISSWPAPAARACSCAVQDPRTAVAGADAAFVGEIVSVSGDAATFRVDFDAKANLGDEVVVRGVGPGESCGFSTEPGERGMLLYVEDDEWRSSLCDEMDPDVLRAAAAPLPAPDGQGAVRFLIGGRFGEVRTIALDAQGRTLAYGTGGGYLADLDVCPGERLVVEAVQDAGRGILAVRDLRSFDVIREQVLVEARYPRLTDVECLDADATRLFAVEWPKETVARVHEVTGSEGRVLFEGEANDVVLLDGTFLVNRGREGGTLVEIDPVSGDSRVLAQLPAGTSGVAVSPDGTRFAGFAYGGDRGEPARVVVVDASATPAVLHTADLEGPNEAGDVVWTEDGLLVYLPGGGDHDVAHVYDAELNEVATFEGWQTARSLVAGGTVYGVGWGSLYAAGLPGGPAEVLRTFDGPETFALAFVPGDVRIGRAGVPSPDVGSGATPPPGAGRSMPWLAGVALVGAAAGAAVAWRARRRRPDG